MGVDINPAQVEDLRGEGFEAFTPDQLPERKFDLLFMSHIIEHLGPSEVTALFRHYLPYLKEEGRLVVLSPVGGHRFWYDFTHVRPYYPQSLWMFWGGNKWPASDRLERVLDLEEVRFFNDPFKIRHGATLGEAYYPCNKSNTAAAALVKGINSVLEGVWRVSRGKIGVCSSWLGIYKFTEKRE